MPEEPSGSVPPAVPSMPNPSTPPPVVPVASPDELEIARSKVRRRVTYGAGIITGMATLWGLWQKDPAIYTPGLTLSLAILSFWFGQRTPAK